MGRVAQLFGQREIFFVPAVMVSRPAGSLPAAAFFPVPPVVIDVIALTLMSGSGRAPQERRRLHNFIITDIKLPEREPPAIRRGGSGHITPTLIISGPTAHCVFGAGDPTLYSAAGGRARG